MPVRINLKELFGNDSQEITVEKVNFNFNKLLELGIGLKGDIGITGPVGSAGPSGPDGPQGDRGTYWYVGTGDPNLGSFPDAVDEDFYLNSDDSQILQYDEALDTWNLLIDLGGVVNDYLSTQGSSFVRGYGEGSPSDSRFIVFPNRGNTQADFDQDRQGASVQSDILLLSNFDESATAAYSIEQDLSDTDSLYNALQKIYVNVTNPLTPTRHGLEVGSLFDWQHHSSNPGFYVTDFKENLKLHHIGYDLPENYPGGIYHDVNGDPDINNDGVEKFTKGIISMTGDPVNADQDKHKHLSILEIRNGAWDRAGGGAGSLFNVQIGSRQSLAEEAGYVKFDGINFQNAEGENAGIGLAPNYVHKLSELNGEAFLMLDAASNTGGILAKTSLYQDFGNIEQLGTGPASVNSGQYKYTYSATGELSNTANTYGNGALVQSGNVLYAIQSEGSSMTNGGSKTDLNGLEGKIWSIDTSNPMSPFVSTFNDMDAYYISYGEPNPLGAGIKDADYSGGYIVTVSDLNPQTYNIPTPGTVVWGSANLQILKPTWKGVEAVGTLANQINGAYRVSICGTIAMVFGNRLRSWDLNTNSGSTYESGSNVTAVDISDPANPTVLATLPHSRTHFLDSESIGNNVTVAMSVYLGQNFGTNGFNNNKIRVSAYKSNYGTLGDQSAIINKNILNAPSITTSNWDNPAQWSIYGAIAVSGNKIYAAYQNKIYTLLYSDHSDGKLDWVNTYEYDSDDDLRALDMKISGQDLYILTGSGGNKHWTPNNTHVVKVSVRNQSSPETVSKADTGEASATKMQIIGNTIYLNKVDGTDGIVIPIEIDGFKTNSASIGKLRSDDIAVVDSITTGGSVSVEGGLGVGDCGIQTSGDIAAKDATFVQVDAVDINASNDINAGADIEAVGNVIAGVDVEAGNDVTADGDITAVGSIGAGTTLTSVGNTTVGGNLTINTISTGNVNATGTNVLVSNSSGLVQEVTASALVAQSGNGVPCGAIIMWSGAVANIPAGWALCDGQTVYIHNGSITPPDLRGKFIASYDANNPTDYDIGVTGGEESVTLTASQSGIRSHYHTIPAGKTGSNYATGSDEGGHTHSYKMKDGSSGNAPARGQQVSEATTGLFDGAIFSNGSFHKHTIAAHNTEDVANDSGAPAEDAHENRPLYYTLAFIMKYDTCTAQTATQATAGATTAAPSKFQGTTGSTASVPAPPASSSN